MAEFWGDDAAVARQKRLLERRERLDASPWLAGASRLLFVADMAPDAWEASRDWIEEDGVFATIAASEADFRDAVHARLGAAWDVNTWRAYFGTPDEIQRACPKILSERALPAGWSLKFEEQPSDEDIDEFQRLNDSVGVSPSPAAAMCSQSGRPALSTFVRDTEGDLKAVSWAGMFFHPDSAYGQTAFAGLVAVDNDARGLGLGKFANAAVLVESQKRMGWARATEFVHADNPASVAMVTASGLSWDGVTMAAIASKGMGRFTR